MFAVLSTDGRRRVVGMAVGLCLAVALLFASRVTAGSGGLGAELRMAAGSTGELSVSPGGPFLSAVDLRPGNSVGGRLLVGNQTGATLAVDARAERSSPDLDDQVRVRVLSDGTVAAEGTLGELADGRRLGVFPSGHRADVTFEVSLTPGATRYQGRLVDVDLRLSVQRAGA